MMARMLRPTLNEELIESVIPLVGQLATSAPAVFGQHAQQLLTALVVWLGRCRLFGLVQAAVHTFSMVVLTPALGAAVLIDVLDRTPEVIEQGSLAQQSSGGASVASSSCLPLVLRMWVDCVNEVLHPSVRKAMVAALVELISPRYPQLCALPATAEVPLDTSAPRTTRSAAARRRRGQQQQQQAQQVPLLVRVFQMSVRTYQAIDVGQTSNESAMRGGRALHQLAAADEEDDDEGEEEDDEEGEEDEEGGGAEEAEAEAEAVSSAAARRRASPFVPADAIGAYSVVNLSDALDEQSGEESDDGSEEENEADAATDPSRSIELGGRLAAYVKALRESLGEQQFGALCATLTSPEERRAVERAVL